jgi:hypothetical protein
VECDNLCMEIQVLPIEDQNDILSWSLEASGEFATRSVYLSLSQGAVVTHFKEVWHTSVR